MPGSQPSGKSSLRDFERRRSGRIYLKLPVLVRWKTDTGEPEQEPATTEELNSTGGLLRIRRLPPDSAEIVVTHTNHEEPVGARVVRSEDRQEDGLTRIAITYAHPVATLWGVTFPPARAAGA